MIKISSVVDERVWADLRRFARESNRSISGLLTEAISDLLRRRRVRPRVLEHLEKSMNRNEELGRRLAE